MATIAVPPAQSIDVLIADDDPGSRELLAEVLSALGYRCRTVADGAQAWREQQRAPAAVVLTDWTMPGMTGLELCRRIKEAGHATYVVLVTGLDERARLIEGLRAGADDFLRKPIDLDELEVRLLAASRLIETQRELARANHDLQLETEREFRTARTDRLTGVGNRVRLDEDLARLIAERDRYGRRCSAAVCDVDHFKQFNDRYGHLAGDDALRRVAAAIRDAVRDGDSVYRYGGEEFVVLLPEQSVDSAVRAMERVRAAVEALAIPHSGSPLGIVTISIGVAELGRASAAELIARADGALYAAKYHGRNRVCVEDGDAHGSLAAH